MNNPARALSILGVALAAWLVPVSASADVYRGRVVVGTHRPAPVAVHGPARHGTVGVHRPGPLLAYGYGHRHGWHGGNVRFGLYLGAPWYGYGWPGYYYGSPYYYPPAVVTVPVSPPTYIEQAPPAQTAPTAPQPGYWYYCADAGAYYPYVKECPAGWQRVLPQPPPG